MAGSLYTLKAQLQDNLSGPLNNVTNNIKNSAKQTEKASRDVKQFQNSISSCTGALSSFATALKTGDFSGFAQGAVNAGIAVKNLGPILTGLKANLAAITAEVTACTGGLNLLIAGIAAVGVGAVKSNVDLQSSQKSLQSLLGVSDQVVDEYTQDAIEMSRGTTRAAGEILDAFTLIGSQAPQLLDDKEGLEGVTKAAMTLSTAAKMDVVDAAKAITTAMNQLGLSADESTNIIDAMAMAAQKGSADIQYQVEALNKSGAAARLAKVSFTELISAIEGIATSFPSAEVAGTKLNALFIKLEAQTNQKFKPSIVGLKPALDNLANAHLSAADKVKLFGQGNLSAAEALIKNRDTIAQMNTALQEHGTALQMAETNADTLEGKWNKLKNAFSTLFAELGQSEIIKVLVDALEMLCVVLTKAINIIGKILHPFMEFFSWVNKIATALIQKLIPYIQDAVRNGLDYFRKGWANLINAVGNNALVRNITKIFNKAVDIVLKAIAKIKQLWNDFLKWLGLSTTTVQTPKVKFETVSETDTETITTTPTGGGGKGSKGGKGTKSTSTKTKTYAAGSLEDLEQQLSELQRKYKGGLISIVDYEKDLAELEKKIKQKKIELKLEIDVNDALKQLSVILGNEQEIEAKIKAEDPKNLMSQLETLTKSISNIQVKIKASDPDNVMKEMLNMQDQIYDAKIKVEELDPQKLLQQLHDIKDKEVELKLKVSEQDPNSFVKQLIDLEKTIEDLNKQKVELEASIKVSEEDIQLENPEDQTVTVEVETKTAQLEALQAQISSMEDKYKELKIKVDTELQNDDFDKIKDLYTELDKIQDQKKEIQIAIQTTIEADKLRELDELNAKIEELESKKLALSVDIETTFDKQKQQELLELENTLNNLKSQKVQIEAQIKTDISDEAQKHIDELNQQLSKLDEQKHQIEIKLGFDTKEVNNSLKSVQDRINAYKEKLNLIDPKDTVLINYIRKQIEDLTKQEKEIKFTLGIDTKPAEGSLKDIQNKLSEANTKLSLADPNDLKLIAELRKQIDDLTKDEKEIKFTLGIDKKAAEGSLKDIQDKLSKKKTELSMTAVGTPEYYALIKEIQDLEKEEYKIKIQVDSDSLTEYEKKMKEFQKSQNTWNSVGSTVRSFGDAMNAIGQATDDQTAKVLAGFASIASAIAELIPQIMALVAARNAQALAEGTASAAGIGFPQNLAAIAAVVATILGVIGTIASVSKGFAQGGLITGSSTVGDHMIARVNAGEMVLNNRQQAHLWNLLNGSGSYNSSPREMTVGQVRIKGSDLFLALKNYSKHQRKLGIDTGIH